MKAETATKGWSSAVLIALDRDLVLLVIPAWLLAQKRVSEGMDVLLRLEGRETSLRRP